MEVNHIIRMEHVVIVGKAKGADSRFLTKSAINLYAGKHIVDKLPLEVSRTKDSERFYEQVFLIADSQKMAEAELTEAIRLYENGNLHEIQGITRLGSQKISSYILENKFGIDLAKIERKKDCIIQLEPMSKAVLDEISERYKVLTSKSPYTPVSIDMDHEKLMAMKIKYLFIFFQVRNLDPKGYVPFWIEGVSEDQ